MTWKLNPFTGSYQYVETSTTEESLSANRLEIDKIASGSIGYLQLVTLIDNDTVEVAGVDSRQKATIFGLALNTASDGDLVRILLFGHYEDVSLNFSLHENLFQDMNGNLTTTASTIVGEYWTRIGRSYGNGAIFISPEPPVEVR